MIFIFVICLVSTNNIVLGWLTTRSLALEGTDQASLYRELKTVNRSDHVSEDAALVFKCSRLKDLMLSTVAASNLASVTTEPHKGNCTKELNPNDLHDKFSCAVIHITSPWGMKIECFGCSGVAEDSFSKNLTPSTVSKNRSAAATEIPIFRRLWTGTVSNQIVLSQTLRNKELQVEKATSLSNRRALLRKTLQYGLSTIHASDVRLEDLEDFLRHAWDV